MNRILVVDDEKTIVKGLKFTLEQDGYEVDCAYDGGEAVRMAQSSSYDMILLDLMLPVLDGLEVCTRIRENSEVPIIMLTAKGDDLDKIKGLDCGADDYITKPFNILEVKARIKAILRRNHKTADTLPEGYFVTGDLKLDCIGRRLYVRGREIDLTAKEFEVLELLVKNPDHIYNRDNLLKLIWGYDFTGDSRTVDVHIRRLREKIVPNPSEPIYVHTKWGVGYYYTLNA